MIKNDRYRKIYNDLNIKLVKSYKDKKLQIFSFIRLGLFAKYIKSIKAICNLDMNGFYEDAKIILRTVFETFITIMYCEVDPKERYKRFYDFNIFTRSKYFEGTDDIYKLIQELYGIEIEKLKLEIKEFRKKYNPKSIFSWNDMSTKKLCNELDLYYNTTFYSLMYTEIYMQYSEFIHPNIVNVFENYISIENGKLNINNKIVVNNDNAELIDEIEEMNERLLKLSFE